MGTDLEKMFPQGPRGQQKLPTTFHIHHPYLEEFSSVCVCVLHEAVLTWRRGCVFQQPSPTAPEKLDFLLSPPGALSSPLLGAEPIRWKKEAYTARREMW